MADIFKEYFRHDYHARSDDKTRKLRRMLGLEGYGLFWCLVEIMYEQGGQINENEVPDIAFDLHTDEQKAFSILNDFDLFTKNGDNYSSGRVVDTLEKRAEKSEMAKAKGVLGAQKRWGNVATAIQTDSKTIANKRIVREENNKKEKNKEKETNKEINNSNINTSIKKESPQAGGFNAIISSYSSNEKLQSAIFEFIKMRKLIKKPLTDRALTLTLKELDKLSKSDNGKIAILEKSISRCWQGVFPLNSEDKPSESTDINKAIDVINNRRNQAELEQSSFLSDIRKVPEFAEAESKVDGLRFDISKAECQGKDTTALKEQLKAAEEDFAEALRIIGYSLDDLITKYFCEKCKDTGFINGQQCECLKRIMED